MGGSKLICIKPAGKRCKQNSEASLIISTKPAQILSFSFFLKKSKFLFLWVSKLCTYLMNLKYVCMTFKKITQKATYNI